MLEDDVVKKLAEVKTYYEKRAIEMENEVSMLRSLLEIIDKILAEKSFKKIDMSNTKSLSETSEYKETISIKATDGTSLANIYVGEGQIKLIPNIEINFDVNSPPFKAFLITRIFDKMREKDIELAKKGDINVDEIFSYRVEQKDDFLKEIVIENYGDERRLFELRNAIRWTLRRIYEKMASPGDQS